MEEIKWKISDDEDSRPVRSQRVPVRKPNVIVPISSEHAYHTSLEPDMFAFPFSQTSMNISQGPGPGTNDYYNSLNKNMNPFFVNNNYLEDITNQDKFLKPIATNTDKTKST